MCALLIFMANVVGGEVGCCADVSSLLKGELWGLQPKFVSVHQSSPQAQPAWQQACDEEIGKLQKLHENWAKARDLRYFFVGTHACVAALKCKWMREGKIDAKWGMCMDKSFVTALEEVVGKYENGAEVAPQWKDALNYCKSKKGSELFDDIYDCASKMAEAHIKVDLEESLVKCGLGTDDDFNDLGHIVLKCMNELAQKTSPPSKIPDRFNRLLKADEANSIKAWREEARERARKRRNE